MVAVLKYTLVVLKLSLAVVIGVVLGNLALSLANSLWTELSGQVRSSPWVSLGNSDSVVAAIRLGLW